MSTGLMGIDPPTCERARAAVCFDKTARVLVSAKYGDLAPIMGRWTANAGRKLTREVDLLVPLRCTGRQWARRFNQSALLADVVAKASRLKAAQRALRRLKAPQQVGVARTERAVNVRSAFGMPKSRRHEIERRQLILADDVPTSGATLEAPHPGARALRVPCSRRPGFRPGRFRPGCGAHASSHIDGTDLRQYDGPH